MKKLKNVWSLLSMLLLAALVFSCNDESEVDLPLDDSSLIDQIANATNSQTISITALPTTAQVSLTNDYAESFVTNALLAPSLGYQVNLRLASGADVGESSSAFFDLDGRELNATFGARSRFGRGERVGRRARGLRDCFDFVFPISLTLPDGSSLTLESADDWSLVRDWYEANPDAEGRPEFVFPLDVQFGDSTFTVSSAEELREAKGACEVDRKRGRCFDLVFPVTFSMPDGSEISLNSREDWPLIDDWYEANPDVDERPSLVFPVQIQYANDSIVTINSAEEMRDARAVCEVNRGRERCFSIDYPVSFTMPDGTVITLDSRDDWTLIRDWYEANPDEEEKPGLVFPITITYENGTMVTVNSEEELRAARADCN